MERIHMMIGSVENPFIADSESKTLGREITIIESISPHIAEHGLIVIGKVPEVIVTGDLVRHRGIQLEVIVPDSGPHVEPAPSDIRKVDFLHHIEIGHLIVTGSKLELITVGPLENQ